MFKRFLISIIIILSLLILFYSLFQSEITYEGNRRKFYLLYVIASLIFILFGFVLFFLNNKMTTMFLIILSSLVFSIYLFEFYVTYLSINRLDDLNIKKKSEMFKNMSGKNYDTRTKYSYYLNQKKTNQNIKIDINTVNLLKHNDLEIFPLSGYSNSEVILCNEFGYYKHIKTDRYGFNNLDNIWDAKKFNYALIGDSFIEGYCQDEKNTIHYKLTKLFGGNIINLAQGGAGSLQEYAIILEYLPENTKGLIWFICDNDIIDLQKEISNKKLYRYLLENNSYQNLKLNQNSVDETFKQIFEYEEQLMKKNEFKRFLKLNYLRSYFHSFLFKKNPSLKIQTKYKSERYKDFLDIMNNIKKISLDKNIELHVVYLPTYNYFKDDKYLNKDYKHIINILKKLSINYLDLNIEIFDKEKNPQDLFPFGFYGHYNNYGSDEVSKAIHRFVDK